MACLPCCMPGSGAHYWLLFAFTASCTAVLLIILLCCAWEHPDNSRGDAPGLAGDQSVAAVLDRLEFQCDSSQSSPVDESTLEHNTPEHLWLQISPCQSRYWAVLMPGLQQVYLQRDCGQWIKGHLKATLPMDMSMPQQVYPGS